MNGKSWKKSYDNFGKSYGNEEEKERERDTEKIEYASIITFPSDLN